MPLRFTLRCSLLALVAACGGGDPVSVGNGMPVMPMSSQVASVVITPQTILLAPGDTVRLVAATRDVSGAPLPGRVVAWSSDAPANASVSSSGLVTALVAGRSVRITAVSEGASGSAVVTTGN